MNSIKQFVGICLFSLVSIVAARSQQFTHVDWSRLLCDSVLPHAYRSVDLGDVDKMNDCRIEIEYPEWAVLTKSEQSLITSMGIDVPDSLTFECKKAVSRKRGVGEVSVFPLIRQNGRLMKLLSFSVKVRQLKSTISLKSTTLKVDRYATHSLLSSGRWVKIRVAQEGVFLLTPALIKQMGFSDIDKVKVYGYGGRVQNMVISYNGTDGDTDDIEEVPTMRRSDGLLFFANGTLRWSDWLYSNGVYYKNRLINPYSSYSYYFVTEGENPNHIQAELTAVNATSQPLTTYPEQLLIENDAYSWYTSGCNLFDSYNYANGSTKNYTLLTPDATNEVKAKVSVVMSASSSVTTNVNVSLNSSTLGSFNIGTVGKYDHAKVVTGDYKTNELHAGENTLQVKTTAGNNARLDYILVNYYRTLKLKGTFLCFSHYQKGAQNFLMKGADNSTQIWRIGTAGSPTCMVPSQLSGDELSFAVSDATRRYVAVNTSAVFPSPEIVGRIDNQDLHADSLADMVIIVPASGKLLAQAQRLAEAHRIHDNLKINIVRADQIYNEFSSGTPDAGAYRRYLKMLYDRATSVDDMPRYLLLFGSTLWDNRMLTSQTKNLNPNDYLLCYESENSVNEVSSYVSDDFFGYLDDGEGKDLLSEKIDIGIGRFPVTSDADAQIIVDKTIKYMLEPVTGASRTELYMMADDGDKNSHMKDMEEVVRQVERSYPELVVKRIYWDAFSRVTTATGSSYPDIRAKIMNVMRKGALVMNYSGHGAPYQISVEQVLKLADFKEFNAPMAPLWVFAACEVTPYDMPVENIGEVGLLNKNGTAIAVYSAARAGYSDLNKYVNKSFMKYVLGTNASGRRYTLGDAARLAKVSLVSSEDGSTEFDYTINKLKYALIGDPAVTLAKPVGRVVLDSINDLPVGGDIPIQLQAGSTVKIKGHIENVQGQKISEGNGYVNVLLRDSKDTITCKDNQNEGTPYVFYERTKTLHNNSVDVTNGEFTSSFRMPLDINYSNSSGCFSFYSVVGEQSFEAAGSEERFTIGGSVDLAGRDSLGPRIYAYLNSPEFKDGDVVNETPFFMAELSDSDGVNTTGSGVGHDIQLIIDGDAEHSYILNDYYSDGVVSYHLPELAAGEHQLFFRAWDLLNNSSSCLLKFRVEPGQKGTIFDVNAMRNPAKTNTVFLVSFDRPDTDFMLQMEVYDCFGRLWWRHQVNDNEMVTYKYPVNWNLTSNSGAPLPSGLYLYKATLVINGEEQSTKTKKIIIHRQ